MSPAHKLPQHGKRRLIIGLATAATLTAVTAVAALASGGSEPADQANQANQAIACPSPNAAIPAVPASARAEVDRELANLDKQIAEANERLRTSVGQGGANFVQNAILGPLASKRVAALNRIETAIGRAAAKPDGLERFATCALGAAGAQPQAPSTSAPAAAKPPVTTSPQQGAPAAGGAIACPSPNAAIPAVPASARAEVDRELANLDKQVAEANERLRTSVGQGGANFVQNAILGPLASKRVAALNRIETAIGRAAAKPEGLERFATCALR